MVASTVVSSRMLAAIAAEHGARHVETLTGFKWLARADAGLPGCTLVYAYEEAIGHCVDPAAVRDKDGISAAVLACDLVAALREQGRTVLDALDDLARRHGVHTTTAVSRRVADADGRSGDGAAARRRRRSAGRLRGDGRRPAAAPRPAAHRRADLSGGDEQLSVRVVVRPSGTEPKVKCYIEIRHERCRRPGRRASQRRRATNKGRSRGGQPHSARAELTIPGIAETRHDIGDVVEPVVDGRGEQP